MIVLRTEYKDTPSEWRHRVVLRFHPNNLAHPYIVHFQMGPEEFITGGYFDDITIAIEDFKKRSIARGLQIINDGLILNDDDWSDDD